MTRSRLSRLAFVIVATAIVLPTTSHPMSAVGQTSAALLALTGNQILDRVDKMLDEKMFNAEQAASGLLNQALNGMSVLSDAARLNLADVSGKTLTEMNQQQRQVFLNLQSYLDTLNDLSNKAYNIAEVTNVDVANRLGSIPSIPEAVFISSLHGVAIRQWDENHKLTIIGTGLGPGEAGVKADVTFRLDGKLLLPRSVDPTQHNQSTYLFPVAAFAKYQSPDQPKSMILAVHLAVERTKYLGWFKSRKDVDTKIVLTNYPSKAGSLSISYDVPQFGYKVIERRTQKFRTSDCGNGKCDRQEGATTDIVASGDVPSPPLGNRMVANPAIACTDPWWDPKGCEYTYGHTVTVNSNKTAINAAWRVTGVWVSMAVSFDVMEWSRLSPKSENKVATLVYNRIVDVCLPPNVDYAKLHGTLSTKQEFEVAIGASVAHILQFQGKTTCTDGGTRYSYLVLTPA